MYGYVRMKMQPMPPLSSPSSLQSYDKRPAIHMIHAANSIRRAQAKENRYSGLEIDIFRAPDGNLTVAHDEHHLPHAIGLEELFSSLKHPETKTFWLDLKIELTQKDIDALKKLSAAYHIHPRRMLFEVAPGTTADLLIKNGFPILLPLPHEFYDDGGDVQKRQELNSQAEDLLIRYHPLAIVGSLGKYPYLQAYFPHYNKAIYSSTTVRPSLKKYFLTKAMFTNPSVLVWMQDEYTVLPF